MNTTTYAQWYDLPDTDLYRGRYEEVFRSFNANDPVLIQPGALFDLATVEADAKWAFAALNALGEIHVYHRARRLVAFPLMDPDPQDNLNVALLDDVAEFGTYVEFPADAFWRTAPLDRILSPAATSARIALRPADLQTTVEAEVANADLLAVRTRFFMWIPPCIVGQVLRAAEQPEGLNPRDLWLHIAAPLFLDEVLGPQCVPFIDWCRAAYSGGTLAVNPVKSQHPTAVRPRGRLAETRSQLLRSDLPDRYLLPRPPPPPPPLAPMYALPPLDAEQVEAAVVRANERVPAVTTPSKRWSEGIDLLYLLCGVAEDEHLPPVWTAMAKEGQRKDRITLQFHLNRDDERLGPSGRSGQTTYITSTLSGELGGLRFVGETVNQYKAGLSIFLVSFPTHAAVACLRQAVDLFDQQMNNVQSLTLSEVTTLRDDQTFKLPSTFNGVKKVVYVYHRLLSVLLGFEHPITRAFVPFVAELDEDEGDQLAEYFNNNVHRCGGLLREIQISMYHWLVPTLKGRLAVIPNFLEPLALIAHYRWPPPSIPGVTGQPTTKGSPAPAAAGSTSAGKGVATRAGSNTRVIANPAYLDHTLVPKIPNFQPKTYIETHGLPPLNDKNTSFCLFYHCIEFCVSDCQRKEDHRKHTKAESAKLAAYLKPAMDTITNA